MEQLLQKKQLINSTYEVQFFIGGTDLYQKYRVKGKDGKTYLLKLYNSSKLPSANFSGGNLLEVEILSMFNTPNIIRLVNNGELILDSCKYHFIIFDFIPGETLQDKLKRKGAFSPYAEVPLITQILEILEKIHKHPKIIIHNNINPGSITLDYRDEKEIPVLTDFGFARYISSKSNSVDIQGLNPFYIAPELYNGIFTPQSDIFSVGALFYHLLIGLPPWYVEIPKFQYTPEKLKSEIHKKRLEPLTFGLRGVLGLEDEHLIETIKKALALNVDERFKDTTEFIKALKREVVLSAKEEKKAPVMKATKKEGEGFSAIAGMQNLKDILYNDVIRALNEKELYERYGITIPNGMLLYGPPGCGKTFISEKFAEEVGFNFIQLKPSDIKSKYINATEEKIGEIFREAIEKAPTTIFIDEIDAVVPNREGDLHHMNASPVNEFLAQMSNCSEKGVFVIAASNRPEKIDPAILRAGRIDRIIYLPPPDFEARVSMFRLYLKKRPIDLGIDYEELASLTENYVSSDIKFLIDEASRYALKNKERITQSILRNTITMTPPSVSFAEIKKYEQLKSKLEDKKQKGTEEIKRKPVGFRRPDKD